MLVYPCITEIHYLKYWNFIYFPSLLLLVNRLMDKIFLDTSMLWTGYEGVEIFFLQICIGEVTTVHLYQGAFVDIGGVHDG